MLKAPYEEFLAQLCCSYLDDVKNNDSKYHYVCSNPEQAVNLFNGFRKIGFSHLTVNGALLNYITTGNGLKAIVMLHHVGEATANTYHEDFIASVRDELNNLSNTILLVIHNSSLETILSTCKNLSLDNRVYTPKFVQEKLVKLAQNHPSTNVVNALIARREKIITEQKRSVFAYQSVYNTIIGNTIDFREESLFEDSRLEDNDNLRQIKGDIEKNAALHQSISNKVKDAGDNKNELEEYLEEIGLGEKFIKAHFFGRNGGNWESVDYRTYQAEIETNKTRKLDLTEIELNNEKLETWKRASVTGAKRKVISVVIEVEQGVVDLRFRMAQGDPLLKVDQIKLSGDYKLHQVDIGVSNHEKQAVLKAQLDFNGEPKFFQIKLKRASSSESLQFNCIVVEKSQFNITSYFEKVTVDFRRSKGKLLLENVDDIITLNASLNELMMFKADDEVVDCEAFGQVSFKDLLENEISGEFCLK